MPHFCYLVCDIAYDVDYDGDHKLAKLESICGTIEVNNKQKSRVIEENNKKT